MYSNGGPALGLALLLPQQGLICWYRLLHLWSVLTVIVGLSLVLGGLLSIRLDLDVLLGDLDVL